jgi:hypothetical protein
VWDAFADSRARLERLLEPAMKEKDAMKSGEPATEIRLVLDEREFLRNTLFITEQLGQEN